MRVPRLFRKMPGLYVSVRIERIVYQLTSIEAWRRIKDTDYLTELDRSIWLGCRAAGPCTGSELYEFMTINGWLPLSEHYGRSAVTRRLRTLERWGCLQALEERTCLVTGNPQIVWAVTHRFPVKVPPKKRVSLKKLLQSVLNVLTWEYATLVMLDARHGKSLDEAIEAHEELAAVIRCTRASE